ncbi:MAG: prolipoprotein diacylglyceryl transferase, partial [Firmicutes bacterium]|nr:prolipoprotein diacylglyceryl transferase [Bacillota bacterium]
FKKLWAKITSKPQPKFKRKPENQRATFWQMADLALMFMILGQAIGRWGNFANQEVFGIEVSRHIFPFTVSIDRTGTYHLALFFYESMWNLAGFGIMYFLYQGKRKSFDGFILAVYLIWYGIGRAAMEPLRDSRFQMGNNLINLILAIAMILIGLIIIIHHLYKARTLKMKPFIFVEQSKLTEKYLGYRQSILHHPNIYEPKAKRAADLDDEFYSEADEGFTAEDADEFYGREDGNHEVENAVEKEDSVVEKAEETKAEKAEETTPKTKEIKETKKSKPIESEDEGFSAEDAEEFFKSTETDDDGFYSVD